MKLHFRKIIQKHTDISLGDCSFLNTCFHMNTCKYIHYEVDYSTRQQRSIASSEEPNSLAKSDEGSGVVLYPPQVSSQFFICISERICKTYSNFAVYRSILFGFLSYSATEFFVAMLILVVSVCNFKKTVL